MRQSVKGGQWANEPTAPQQPNGYESDSPSEPLTRAGARLGRNVRALRHLDWN